MSFFAIRIIGTDIEKKVKVRKYMNDTNFRFSTNKHFTNSGVVQIDQNVYLLRIQPKAQNLGVWAFGVFAIIALIFNYHKTAVSLGVIAVLLNFFFTNTFFYIILKAGLFLQNCDQMIKREKLSFLLNLIYQERQGVIHESK